ncbi:hypothetical protein FO488_15955 [Geobacter sp. FeAm09]|uniref:type IV secretion system DNA-binding domain-containing protein n=1 Tax=Geobacter sp. FeAm09 TaxID=2597769 RepID=UPI0011EC3DAF|nr:type IV secretion system DNA-binding domain-containing protein [Geobacter sp. FeAm09]QEM69502.1 hypothetical protein FO488_15955 [Geobacter sp. FeAm09]
MADRNGYQKVDPGIGQKMWDRNVHLTLERYFHAFFFSFLAWLVSWGGIVVLTTPRGAEGVIGVALFVFRGLYYGIFSVFYPDYKMTFQGKDFAAIWLYESAVKAGLWHLVLRFFSCGAFALVPAWLVYLRMQFAYKEEAEKLETLKHVGGTSLDDEKKIMSKMARMNKEQPNRGHVATLPLAANLFLSKCNEVFGTLIVGAPGAGKTVLISHMLEKLKSMPVYRVIAYTFKGDFVERFYDPGRGDIIFNAFDLRSLRLNVFDLIRNSTDFLRVATILIPEPKGQADPFWTTAARDCFAAMLNYCYMRGEEFRNNAEVWSVLCYTRQEILLKVAPYFGSEETLKYFSDEKLASNVSAVIAGYTGIFKFLPRQCDKFDMKKWLEGKGGNGWIFITNHEDLSAVLKPWLTLFVDCLVSAHLSLPDSYERRVVYELDELNTLHATVGGTIHKLAITGRSKGAVPILGFQGLAGMEKTLGREVARDVCNAMGNSMFLRVGSDPETAKWMSDVISDTVFIESEISNTYKTGDTPEGGSVRQVRKTEKLAPAAEFLNVLPSLEGYARLAEYGVTKAHVDYVARPVLHEAFVPRPDLDLAAVEMEVAAAQARLKAAESQATTAPTDPAAGSKPVNL